MSDRESLERVTDGLVPGRGIVYGQGLNTIEGRDRIIARSRQATGRMIWLDPGDGPFEGKEMEELWFHVEDPIGRQSGTYFKTSLFKDGMAVWRWGGVHPVDLARGVRAS